MPTDVRCGSKADLPAPSPTSALPLKADSKSDIAPCPKVPCVDGSGLARAFFTFCSIGRCSHVFGL